MKFKSEDINIISDLRQLYLQLYGLRIYYNLPMEVDDIISKSYNELEETISGMLPPLEMTREVLCELELFRDEYDWMVKPFPNVVIFGTGKPVMHHYIWQGDCTCSEDWVKAIPLRINRIVNMNEFIEEKVAEGALQPCGTGEKTDE